MLSFRKEINGNSDHFFHDLSCFEADDLSSELLNEERIKKELAQLILEGKEGNKNKKKVKMKQNI